MNTPVDVGCHPPLARRNRSQATALSCGPIWILVIVFSACPQDITPINGPELTPRDARFEVAEVGAYSERRARPRLARKPRVASL